MTAEQREELISAYLDGELSDDERARVEKWLAESSQLRRLHAELRAMRAGMQSLATHKLDHDISGAVLRRAEQAVLRGGESKPQADTIRPSPRLESWWNRGAGWRRVVWPALAVAAALAILVYDANRRPPEGEVALTLERDELAVAPESGRDELGLEREEAPAASESLLGDRAGPSPLRGAADADTDALPALEYRVEPQQREMLEKAARPSAVPAAPESAAPSASRSGSLRAPARQLQGAGALVLKCTPQFLRDREFEVLLDKKKIKWRRIGETEKRQKKSASGKIVDKVESLEGLPQIQRPATATYFVSGTPKQVELAIKGSEGNVQWQFGLNARDLESGEYFRRYAKTDQLPPEVAADARGGMAGGFTITLIAPAVASEPAEPAASAPADESP